LHHEGRVEEPSFFFFRLTPFLYLSGASLPSCWCCVLRLPLDLCVGSIAPLWSETLEPAHVRPSSAHNLGLLSCSPAVYHRLSTLPRQTCLPRARSTASTRVENIETPGIVPAPTVSKRGQLSVEQRQNTEHQSALFAQNFQTHLDSWVVGSSALGSPPHTLAATQAQSRACAS
jgi:hypothetical protein